MYIYVLKYGTVPDFQTVLKKNTKMLTPQKQVEKTSSYMSELGLVEGKDFKVADGPSDTICIQMNTGYNLKSYKPGLEQHLKGSGYKLQLSTASLYVRQRKTA